MLLKHTAYSPNGYAYLACALIFAVFSKYAPFGLQIVSLTIGIFTANDGEKWISIINLPVKTPCFSLRDVGGLMVCIKKKLDN